MSKQISFGFGKPKNSAPTSSKPSTIKPVSLPTSGRPKNGTIPKSSRKTLADDSDEDDDTPPQPEIVTGFTSSGAILSKPQQQKEERIIVNTGNGDWRKRGRKNILPAEVQVVQNAQQNGGAIVTVERNEVSTASGLQFADDSAAAQPSSNGQNEAPSQPEKELTEDEKALRALLDDGTGKPKSNVIIETKGNIQLNQREETDDFRADVASRPESSTLEDYAAMPVEEFGMAMLRGMGQKRRANGEVITLGSNDADKAGNKKHRKQEGFLGIGAKPAAGLEGVELGAWGKAEMRKNNKGQGFFTPVTLEDKRTGERVTEEELERRKKEAKLPRKEEEDWRDRRDKNLERDGRNNYRREQNGSSKRERDDREHTSRSRSDRDRDYDDDRSHGSSHSRRDRDRDRSPNRDVKNRDDRDSSRKDRDKYRDRDHDRDRDRDRDRYDSSSSRHSNHRSGEKARDYDRDDRRYRDR